MVILLKLNFWCTRWILLQKFFKLNLQNKTLHFTTVLSIFQSSATLRLLNVLSTELYANSVMYQFCDFKLYLVKWKKSWIFIILMTLIFSFMFIISNLIVKGSFTSTQSAMQDLHCKSYFKIRFLWKERAVYVVLYCASRINTPGMQKYDFLNRKVLDWSFLKIH